MTSLKLHAYFHGFEFERLASGLLDAPLRPGTLRLPQKPVREEKLGPLPEWAAVSEKTRRKFAFADHALCEAAYAKSIAHGTHCWEAEGFDADALKGAGTSDSCFPGHCALL